MSTLTSSSGSGAGVYDPLVPLTPDDQGGAVIIVAYFLIATSLAFSIVRFVVGRQRLLSFDLDDAFYSAALLFAILTAVIAHLEVRHGLGRHQDTLSYKQMGLYFEYAYTAEFLGIIAMTFAKMSVLLLFRRIMSNTRALQSFVTLCVLIGLYFLFSIFATAFQCGATRPWILYPSTCPTNGDVRYAVVSFNMVTDILLALWILPSLWKLNMGQGSRLVVMALFAARLIVPGAAIGQLVLTARGLASDDQTWVELPYTILLLVVVHLSVIHATLPRIHGFLLKLQTGMAAARVTANVTTGNSSGRRRSGDRRGSGQDQHIVTIGSDDRPRKPRNVDGRLFVSSSSYDYPLPDEKTYSDTTDGKDPDRIRPIPEEAEGNYVDGMRLRPDIMPGSKWSTTIYADHESGKDRTRGNSSSTKGDDNLAMGSRQDEENSQTSIYEDHGANAPPIPSTSAAPATGAARREGRQTHIWKTKEFSYQVEQRGQDGNLVDVTPKDRRNMRGREMTELA